MQLSTDLLQVPHQSQGVCKVAGHQSQNHREDEHDPQGSYETNVPDMLKFQCAGWGGAEEPVLALWLPARTVHAKSSGDK